MWRTAFCVLRSDKTAYNSRIDRNGKNAVPVGFFCADHAELLTKYSFGDII